MISHLKKKTNILRRIWVCFWLFKKNEMLDVIFLQSYSEEIAASAQAWVDKCIVAHGAPSTRLLDGTSSSSSSSSL